MKLPKYLVHLSSHICFIVVIDMEEYGGDLDDDGADAIEFGNTIRGVQLKRLHVLLGDCGIEQAYEG